MGNNNSTSTTIAKGIYKSNNKKTMNKKTMDSFNSRKQFITKNYLIQFYLPVSLWEKLRTIKEKLNKKEIEKAKDIVDLCMKEIEYLKDEQETLPNYQTKE